MNIMKDDEINSFIENYEKMVKRVSIIL